MCLMNIYDIYRFRRYGSHNFLFSLQAGYATPASYSAPVAPAVTTHDEVSAPAKAASVTSSQFHAQDEEGNYSFGYKNPNSARQETGNALTGVTGSYSDGYHTYNYIADDFGFRHV